MQRGHSSSNAEFYKLASQATKKVTHDGFAESDGDAEAESRFVVRALVFGEYLYSKVDVERHAAALPHARKAAEYSAYAASVRDCSVVTSSKLSSSGAHFSSLTSTPESARKGPGGDRGGTARARLTEPRTIEYVAKAFRTRKESL